MNVDNDDTTQNENKKRKLSPSLPPIFFSILFNYKPKIYKRLGVVSK